MATIPAAFRRDCHLQLDGCAGEVDTRASGNGQRVTGYAVNREQGGANYIAHKQTTDEWACRWCLDRLNNPRAAETPLF